MQAIVKRLLVIRGSAALNHAKIQGQNQGEEIR
jgi:hypothetical protein